MHSHLHFAIGDVSPNSFPIFYCEEDSENENCAIFSYKSHRGSRLTSFVVGAVKEVAKSYFQSIVQMERLTTQGIDGCEFTSWRITITKSPSAATDTNKSPEILPTKVDIAANHTDVSAQILRCPFSGLAMKSQQSDVANSTSTKSSQEIPSLCPPNPSTSRQSKSTDDHQKIKHSLLDGGLSGVQMRCIFPFHMIVNRHFVITHVGDRLSQFIPEIRPGFSRIDEIFTIKEPESCDWSWSKLCVRKDSSFVLESLTEFSKAAHDDDGLTEAAIDTSTRKLSGGLYFIGVDCPSDNVGQKGASGCQY
jgi:hypothetical protein